MLSFMYRFGCELWEGGCGDGRKMRGELKYMKGILLGFGGLYAWYPEVDYAPWVGWPWRDRLSEGEGCDEFKGRAVVCGEEVYAAWAELFGDGVSGERTMAFRDGISDYEITESAMNFVRARLGGYEKGPAGGVIGGVEYWRYKEVISGYKTWHGRSVYREFFISPFKESGAEFHIEVISD